MRVSYLLLCTVMMLLQAACASNSVIRDRDYESSMNAYRTGDPGEALTKFPKGEDGGLLTSVEKSWLAIWKQEWDAKPLLKQTQTFDSRNYTSLTREAGYFLMQEAEEGYVPAEHEVVVLHLIAATHFLELGNMEDGMVELRRAGYVLDRYWDDPALRLWLGSLWAAAGHWNEAQVDFRRAASLLPSSSLATAKLKKLAEGSPPPKLRLNFYGVAPIMQWREGNYTPEFRDEPSEPKTLAMRASTTPWFQRHSQRNTALRDVLIKSNFQAQYLGGKAATGAERGVQTVTVFTIKTLAVAVGLAIVGAVAYAAVASGATSGASGEAMGYIALGGIAAGTAIWEAGNEADRSFNRSIRMGEEQKQEDLKIYRVARFLPGWIALALNEADETSSSFSTVVPLRKHGPTEVILVNHY